MTGKHQPQRNDELLARALAAEDYGAIGDDWGISRREVSGIVRRYAKRLGIEIPRRSTQGKNPPRGEGHYAWKGDAASTTTKRERTQALFPVGGPCERCGEAPSTDRHHIDGDTGNNVRGNIAILCRRCHMIVDGRLERLHQSRIRWFASKQRL